MGLRGPGAKPIALAYDSSKPDLFGAPPPPEAAPWQAEGLSRAERVIAFIETLEVTAGKLAGERMVLRPWQRKILEEVYATDAAGGRPVRTAVLSMGRKNGKTGLAAALALCHLVGPEAEPRGEVYSAANDRQQAGKLFNEMVAMIARSPTLTARINIRRFTKELEDFTTGSVFAALSADAATKHGLSPSQANPNASAFEFREAMVRALDTAGNAFARIERNGRGQVTALYHLGNGTVGVERLASGRLRYRVSNPGGGADVLLQDEVLHVRGPSRDGVLGLSPMQIARGALGVAVSQAESADAMLKNAVRPSGILSFPQMLNSGQRDELRKTVAAQNQGARNVGQFFVFDGGAKWDKISMSSEDAEFIAARKLANEDVARIYGLPPTTVGITDKATYSNTEQEARALVQNAIGPLAGRLEAAMMRCLLTDAGRRTLYVEHDLSGLLRGDVSARYAAYATGRQWGWLSPNDVRRLENMSPIADGDEYVRPLNMGPIGTPAPAEPGVG